MGCDTERAIEGSPPAIAALATVSVWGPIVPVGAVLAAALPSLPPWLAQPDRASATASARQDRRAPRPDVIITSSQWRGICRTLFRSLQSRHHVDDRRSRHHEEDAGQDEDDHRYGHHGRQLPCPLLELDQRFLAQLGGERTQRRGERRAILQ